jgi:hypothetical protein
MDVATNERQNVNKLSLLFLAVAGLFAGCATKAPDVMTYHDPYSRTRTDFITENMLETAGPPREIVWLNASRVSNSKDYRHYLEVEYLALPETGLLDIQPGESLVVLADGQELKFHSSGSLNARREQKGEVRERAIYAATGQQLRAIANAKTVKVSITGKNGIVQREFTPANFEKFRNSVTNYVAEW